MKESLQFKGDEHGSKANPINEIVILIYFYFLTAIRSLEEENSFLRDELGDLK